MSGAFFCLYRISTGGDEDAVLHRYADILKLANKRINLLRADWLALILALDGKPHRISGDIAGQEHVNLAFSPFDAHRGDANIALYLDPGFLVHARHDGLDHTAFGYCRVGIMRAVR